MSNETEHTFPLVAVTTRVVTDTILLRVKASTLEEARDKAMVVLKRYPDAHEEDGVDYVYINNRENGESEVHSLELNMEDGYIA